jgi:hypothetical protein
VVYLLENITGFLGGSQSAANTYIPFAHLADLDPTNDLPFPPTSDSTGYDQNGSRPDSNEPTPGSDPYAYMVGDGGTQAFFFNQWLGSEKPTDAGQPGIPKWWTRTAGFGFSDYMDNIDGVAFATNWPWTFITPDYQYSGFNGVLENGDPVAPGEIGLATDGAKAWTLDGYIHPVREQGLGTDEVVSNLLTGSNIDIQLDDAGVGFANSLGIDVESILRVMVYAPADGLVQEGSYIWSTQVSQTWATPVATSITLSPATDYAVAGLEDQSVVATVKDQFGNVMPGVDVNFLSVTREGQLTSSAQANAGNPVTTDVNGQAAVEWGQDSGDWGVERVYAWVDSNGTTGLQNDLDGVVDSGEDLISNNSDIQWVYMDGTGDPGNIVAASNGQQKVEVFAHETEYTAGGPGLLGDWNGFTVRAWLNPGGNVTGALANALYNEAVDNYISTNLHTWVEGEAFFVSAGTPTAVTKPAALGGDTDQIPNWVYDVVSAGD